MATRAKEVTFAVGQIVKLKSGGPEMTVERVFPPSEINDDPTKTYRCAWFAGKKLEHGIFPPAALVTVQPETAQ